jgi:hypothetical protein
MGRRNWWEGENVCVDREVIEEPEKDETSEQRGFTMHMDMTMTSCRDGENFHECTTRVMTDGRRKSIIIKHKERRME